MPNRITVMLFRPSSLMLWLYALAFAVALSMLLPTSQARAACTVPNSISNGQTADATAVMGNFNALKDCVNTVITQTGTPVSGNLTVFSSPYSITRGDISGDCTTIGTLSLTCTKTNGTPFGYFATGTDSGQLTGTVSVNRFANGVNADSSHFLRGDGVWATPTGGGGGTSGTPVVRASTMSPFNAGSVTITWPAGTVAGDVVIIFVSDGYAVNSPPSWLILNNTFGNDWANGLTAAKIMTAADITAGSVTVSISGSFNGIAAALTIDGSTLSGVREMAALRSAGSTSYSSAQLTGLYSATDADLIIGFTYIRGAMNPTIANFTQLNSVNAVNGSGFLGRFTSTLGKLGINETATYPATNNGYYWSVIALR